MIVVHHLDNSRSQRVLWLLEELGVAYEVVRHSRDPSGLAPPTLREIHPLGKAPVIVDDGRVLAESGAILEYLLEHHGNGRLVPPPGTEEALRYRYWMHYAEGSAMPNLLLKVVFDHIETGPVPFLIRPITRGLARAVKSSLVDPQLALHLDHMETELQRSLWFAGDAFTAADIQMSFPVEAAAAKAGLNATRPGLMRYLDAFHARPAWIRAVERGGPYSL